MEDDYLQGFKLLVKRIFLGRQSSVFFIVLSLQSSNKIIFQKVLAFFKVLQDQGSELPCDVTEQICVVV